VPSRSASADSPASRRILAAGACALAIAAAVAWTAAWHLRFTSLWYPDACDYAQLGRRILRDGSMTTGQSFPYVLAWLRAHALATTAPWPNVTRFVLPALVRAASFSVFGVSDFAAVLPDALFHCATVALCFVLGARLAGLAAGWSAAVLVAFSPTMLGYALSGLSETGAGLLVLAAAAAVACVVPDDRAAKGAARNAAVAGALIGLCFLQRSNLVLLIIPAVALILGARGLGELRARARIAAVLCAACVAVASPWLLRNAWSFGTPTLSLTMDRNVGWALLGKDVFYEFTLIDAGQVIRSHAADVVARLDPRPLAGHWSDFFGPDFGPLLPAFVVASVAVSLPPRARVLRTLTWATLLLSFVAFAPLVVGNFLDRYYEPFAPLVVLLVVVQLAILARRFGRAGPAVLAVACSLAPLWWISHGFASTVARRDPALGQWDRWVSEAVAPDAVVASDQSWYVAWQADRPSVRFYGDGAQLAELERGYTPISAVWLTAADSRRFELSIDAAGGAARWRLVRRSDDGGSLWLAAPATPVTPASP
jgi:4-amino-4-deoxy-L-arabinose transferase-like glycosyltransferase